MFHTCGIVTVGRGLDSRTAVSTSAAGTRPRAAATNNALAGSARPSAPLSNRAVSLRAVRLMPRSRSLTDRGLRPAASASSSCVSPASARNCRSSPANPSAGCTAMVPVSPPQALIPPHPNPRDAVGLDTNSSQARATAGLAAPPERHADPVGLLWAARVVIAVGGRQHGK